MTVKTERETEHNTCKHNITVHMWLNCYQWLNCKERRGDAPLPFPLIPSNSSFPPLPAAKRPPNTSEKVWGVM